MSLIHLSKVSALTILAVAIVACSSSGNNSFSNASTILPPSSEQSEAEKEEAERLESIETNRVALLAKAKKAGLSDKQATAYAEANKQATDKVAQTALETLVAEKAAADKAAADKAAAEKAEKERLQKIEANRVVLLQQAKEAGLSEEQAVAYAEANKGSSAQKAQRQLAAIVAENERIALDEALYQAKGEYHNNSTYALGEVTATRGRTSSSCINNYCSKFNSHSLVYNQPYSVVIGEYTSKQDGYRFSESSDITVQGLKTEETAIPTLGKATYFGKAFTRDGNYLQTGGLSYEGNLSYDVNFEDRTGSGSITGLGDTVELQQGTISGTGISAIAQQGYKNGNYLLDFYGKKAEEIAGKVIFDGKDTIGFGGTRGETSKK